MIKNLPIFTILSLMIEPAHGKYRTNPSKKRLKGCAIFAYIDNYAGYNVIFLHTMIRRITYDDISPWPSRELQ